MKHAESIWKPHVTVAAITENEGLYLVVEEKVPEGIRFNQPAGHLEDGESLIEAVIRECLEETARDFEPEYLVGIYRTRLPDVTYLRFAFAGSCTQHHKERPLDDGIITTHWLSPGELEQKATLLRSPTVMRSIYDHQNGHRFPLSLLTDLHH
ncbi:MAG: NUDIX hydrolase [Gammaproteobacteria bacterium]